MTRSGLILDDRYRLDERIAAGGVGQVWRAADLLLERPVAVKVLRPEYADHPETLERFRAEARHAGSLTHPCIAQVYDYGHAGLSGSPYLVMELVNGPSLADMLVVDPVDPLLAMDVVAQAAAGLDAAHRGGLVHRDIKPGNILVGSDGLVKLTDFGIAHAADSAPVTRPGMVMGTTQYIAPERISGGPGTPASDLYSLGIVVYECLTGMPPYDGNTAEVMAGHLYLPMPPLPAGVPPKVGELVARLTAKDPARRLSDAREVALIAARLRDALAAGQPGQVPPGQVRPGQARPGQARPGQARPGQVPPGQVTAPAPVGGVTHPAPAMAPAPAAPGTALAGTPGGPGAPAGTAPPARVGDLDRPFGDRPSRQRRRAALAAGATVLAGAGVAAVLASAALRATPAADHVHAVPPAAQPPAPGSGTSPPRAGTMPVTGGTGPTPGGQRTGHPRAADGKKGNGHGQPAASSGASPSGSGTSGSPSPGQSGSQSGSPAPSPSGGLLRNLLGPFGL